MDTELIIPTRTAQLKKLHDWDLRMAWRGVRMDAAHAYGYDRRYARTLTQWANRIRRIMDERERLYQGA